MRQVFHWSALLFYFHQAWLKKSIQEFNQPATFLKQTSQLNLAFLSSFNYPRCVYNISPSLQPSTNTNRRMPQPTPLSSWQLAKCHNTKIWWKRQWRQQFRKLRKFKWHWLVSLIFLTIFLCEKIAGITPWICSEVTIVTVNNLMCCHHGVLQQVRNLCAITTNYQLSSTLVL